MTYFLVVLATLATSIISGVLSMAGGMILMGVFGFFLSVPAAMVLHGIAQTFSNGSRVWLYRRHIKWCVLGYYSMGAFAVLGLFTTLAFVPSIGLVFLLIGCFPLLALILPTSINLDMTRGPCLFLFRHHRHNRSDAGRSIRTRVGYLLCKKQDVEGGNSGHQGSHPDAGTCLKVDLLRDHDGHRQRSGSCLANSRCCRRCDNW